MTRLFLLIPFIVLISACTKSSTEVDTYKAKPISSTQKQRETCLDWYAYRIDTTKTIELLNLKTEKESDLMVYCEFFKNVADTN